MAYTTDKKLWMVAWDQWEHRNGIAHSPDHPWRMEEKPITAANIKNQFTLGTHGLAPRDHYRLNVDVDILLSYPYDRQKQWLQSILAARQYFESTQTVREEAPAQPVTNMRIGMHVWLRGNNSGAD